jgi:hypothetical protein
MNDVRLVAFSDLLVKEHPAALGNLQRGVKHFQLEPCLQIGADRQVTTQATKPVSEGTCTIVTAHYFTVANPFTCCSPFVLERLPLASFSTTLSPHVLRPLSYHGSHCAAQQSHSPHMLVLGDHQSKSGPFWLLLSSQAFTCPLVFCFRVSPAGFF